MIAFCLAMTCESFADSSSELSPRHVWFRYGYTECTGEVHPCQSDGLGDYESPGSTYPTDYSATMMLCDTGHVVQVTGNVSPGEDVTFTSSNPAVLEIDSEGNVTLKKTGTARITATVPADAIYAESTVYLDVRVDRHEGWIDSVRAHYADRPASWGLDLDVSDGPHQLVLSLRPGASVSYSSENSAIASVDKNGVVTPLSAGTTQILFDVDSGGGKYKPCRFGETIKVSGENSGNDTNDPEDPPVQLEERHVWFTYGCTECTGKVQPCTEDYIGYYESSGSTYPEYYAVTMMSCDTDHVVHVAGDGVTDGNVTFTSSNPAVLDIDSEGNVTVMKTGKAEITATVSADNTYAARSVHLGVTVDKHDGWVGTEAVHYAGRSPVWGLDLDTSDGTQQLIVPLRPGASVRCSSSNPDVLFVEPDGEVTPVSAGTALLRFDVDDGGGKYKAGYFYESAAVTGEDVRKSQEIGGDTGPFTIDWHDGLALELQAKTDLRYSVVSGAGIASVDNSGFVRFTKAGIASVKVTASQSKEYKAAEAVITITARDYAAEEEAARIAAEQEAARIAAEEAERKAAEEEAARKAEEKAALKAEIAKAKSLKRPSFKVRALTGHKIKLTWGKVKNADGYIVYIKYPGSKKFVKAVKKNASIKSVTHKGLTKGRVYCYKVRTYKRVKGKVYYGPFSEIRKARAR